MMARFKDLVFRTNEIDVSAEQVSRAFVVKVFHLYQRRNEWVNWDGDTNLVNRAWSLFDLSLQESTDSAEKQRTQGTKFLIDDVPAICVIGKRYSLLATELFTESPLSHCDVSNSSYDPTLKYVQSRLNSGRWFVSAIYTGSHENLSPLAMGEMFFSRTSHSTGGNSCLAWSLKPRNIDLTKLQKYAKIIEGKNE